MPRTSIKRMPRLWAAMLLALAGAAASAADLLPIQSGQRILFLGDSITQGGTYVEYFEAYVRSRFPDRQVTIIPLGLSSETTSGLSEEGHPFPRPCVHDRIDRALAEGRPDVTVLCYGMNDGIYHPLDEARMAAFQHGVTRAIRKIEATGSRAVMLTPPPFDPLAKKPEQLADAAPFGYGKTYRRYNDTLRAFGRWETTLTQRGYVVGDTNGRMMRYLDAVRRTEPGYLLARDGVHPGPLGHWLMTETLLGAWTLPTDVAVVVQGRVEPSGVIQLSLRSHLPTAVDPRWDRPVDLSSVSRYRLVVPKAAGAARYTIHEGSTMLGETSGAELASAAGLDLMKLPKLSTHGRALELLQAVQKMHATIRPAWLEHVGHSRPGKKQAMPLAEALNMAADMEPRLRQLAAPATIELRLEPVK
jgi:lysophospholipase L1-like esterase